MEPIRTTDNNNGNCPIDDAHLANLDFLNGKTIENLVAENPQLLVFPTCLKLTKDSIEKEQLFSIRDYQLTTYNMMGFVGVNESSFTISSRFHIDEKDYFLHYMLQKVFSINMLDLQFSTDKEDIWEILLIYMFPLFLKNALRQGLYKEYVHRQYNDANVKGSIDVPRHIKENTLFKGTIAYNTREHVYDNRMTQLIRHTIEHIKVRRYASVLNADRETFNAVNQIVQNTPGYTKGNREKVLHDNKKAIHHPYFTEYKPLQNICKRILRHEGISFGKDEKNKAYGIVFDGAWLWEEYLNTILRDMDFVHPESKNGKNGFRLSETNAISERFPDFYSVDHRIVLDAKYKRFENWNPNGENTSDLYQVITYLHCLKATYGGFIFPLEESKQLKTLNSLGQLKGYGGELFKLALKIPQSADSYIDFSNKIQKYEQDFREKINRLINKEQLYNMVSQCLDCVN